MTNTTLNLRGLIGNAYNNAWELNGDIITAFETEEGIITYDESNNVIKACVGGTEGAEYNIAIEEVDGLAVVVDVEELI